MNKIYEVTVTIKMQGLVYCRSAQEAVAIGRRPETLKRLLAERDDDTVTADTCVEGDYQPDYPLLGGGMSYQQALHDQDRKSYDWKAAALQQA